MEIINSVVRIFDTIAPDFEVMLNGALDLLKRSNIYLDLNNFTTNTNLPQTSLFYLPYTLLSYQDAQNIFTVVSVISLFFSIFILLKYFRYKFIYIPTLPVFITAIITFPAKFTIGMGQSNFITLLLISLFLYFKNDKYKLLSSFFIGLLISYKLIFFYLLIIFIFKKQFKEVFISLLTFFSLVLVTSLIYGSFDLYIYYFKNITPSLISLNNEFAIYNQGFYGFLGRHLQNTNMTVYFWLLSSISLIIFNIKNIIKSVDFNKYFSLTILTLLLIDPYSWQHHFILLVIPVFYFFKNIKNIQQYLQLSIIYSLVYFDANTFFLKDNLFFVAIVLYFKILSI